MSKLDRQLDRIHNEERVDVSWPNDEEVDPEAIRKRLFSAVDDHQRRIPLDLRGVVGAPDALIEILQAMQAYARSQDKVVSISYALPAMQEALHPRRRRKHRKERETDAGEIAKSLLDKEQNRDAQAYDPSKAERIVRVKKQPKKWHKYVLMGGAILAGTLIIGAIEMYLIYFDTPSDLVVPQKTFER